MPSCVVKWCKNNTISHKKHQGITFHRFPSSNETSKNDWVRNIRNCRGEDDWMPSKSSVVCSIHFRPSDFYTTEKGLRRLFLYAVPKLLLFGPSCTNDISTNVQEEQPLITKPLTISSLSEESLGHDLEQNSLIASAEVKAPTSPMQLGDNSETEIFASVSSSAQITPDPLFIKQEVHCENLLSETNCTFGGERLGHDDHDQISSSASAQLSQQAQKPLPMKIEVTSELRSLTSLSSAAQIPPNPIVGRVGTDCDERLLCESMINEYNNGRLQHAIQEKDLKIKKQSKKIKILHQNIRRLRNRNKTLKDIFKTLKMHNLVDRDLQKTINENIVTFNLFNNMLLKKRDKRMQYNESMKNFCLTLNSHSPIAYDYVRKTFNFCLPRRSTLDTWNGQVQGDQVDQDE